ncbi:hypothetical protein V8G54_020493 [Vigna mungo]|uniref:Peptidase A1 domain-containing protein n=1 Tax=Vigna mungo TaxID=3915 RepID=A0AAQ3NDY1_VIGMU
MDLKERLVFFLVGLFLLQLFSVANANLVFPVERKFKGSVENLAAIRDHDAQRRGRFLSAVDIPLGGNGRANSNGLYFTKIGLGSPAKDYYVQVDTGSDILWVNCVGCTTCPRKSGLGMDLTLYDPAQSTTSTLVGCNDDFCTSTYNGPISGCSRDMACPYSITYGDGSTTTGSYIKDYITFNQANGDLKTVPDNSTVIFGCGAKQSGTLSSGSEESLDGIIGLGQSNASVLSQLAAAGKSTDYFRAHYNVNLKDLEVGGDSVQLPTDIFDLSSGREAIIDSGTTLAYLPSTVYDQILEKVLAAQPGMKLYLVEEQFTCFRFDDNVDDGFPIVKFTFDEGLTLTTYPHDYLFLFKENMWCVGWQKSIAQSKDGQEIILLGDLVLSNKLVVYDLENMTIGWTDHNCSSSIKVKDDKTGKVYAVSAHDLSSASTVIIGSVLTLLMMLITMLSS